MKNKFYITTTLPYVNADPHIGFAVEILRADVLARYKRQQGFEVFFNTGTDEHGLKIFKKAEAQGISPQEYCDIYADKFNDLKKSLNLSYNSFIRTTDVHHIEAVQEFWRRCLANGDIYKKNYRVKYCIGCELEKTESELVDGYCPLHPGQDLELIDEENYFFRWSKYQERLLELYKEKPDFVLPAHRLTEIRKFVERGLEDFSISRLKEKMPWGVPVPEDDNHVVYVWFDALVDYLSCLGWPKDNRQFVDYWPPLQLAGKDNLRQQAAMWQAMLMSAGITNSKQVLIFGFITVDGQKMSKSVGNVINPHDLVAKYGTEATRYFLLAEIKTFEDSDFSYEKFEKRFNADLANGFGNLVARVANLLEKNAIELSLVKNSDQELIDNFTAKMDVYLFNEALAVLWDKIRESDEFLSRTTPWKLKDKTEIKEKLKPIAQNIRNIAELLQIFMPDTATKVIVQFSEKQIKKDESLFPRL